jgi:hypothetical protein
VATDGTYPAGVIFGDDWDRRTRWSSNSPSPSHSHFLLHRFQPKPWGKRVLARWRLIFFSTQFRMNEKRRLECPIAKSLIHPRRIGLIVAIKSRVGRERTRRKHPLSSRSNAVRFLPRAVRSGIHLPALLQTRRNSTTRSSRNAVTRDQEFDFLLLFVAQVRQLAIALADVSPKVTTFQQMAGSHGLETNRLIPACSVVPEVDLTLSAQCTSDSLVVGRDLEEIVLAFKCPIHRFTVGMLTSRSRPMDAKLKGDPVRSGSKAFSFSIRPSSGRRLRSLRSSRAISCS